MGEVLFYKINTLNFAASCPNAATPPGGTTVFFNVTPPNKNNRKRYNDSNHGVQHSRSGSGGCC